MVFYQEMSSKVLIFLIVIFTLFRIVRFDFPQAYVFDEVYHVFTAREYLKQNKDAWNPWAKPPPKVGYEWLHPPIAKELMALSMYITKSTDFWAARLPGLLLGILSIYLIYLVSLKLFKDPTTALSSALIFSVDGLVFVQSRTGMNDIYLVAFILVSLLFFLKKRFVLSAIFMGVACATKWPGIFLIIVYGVWFLIHRGNSWKQKAVNFSYFFTIPPLIYLLSYTPYFLSGYTTNDLIEMHKQIWWYQTNLKASHDYASPWWHWPINLTPVWYYVEYFEQKRVANIFASGNILVFLGGLISIILTLIESLKKRSLNLFLIVLGYFAFLLPWSRSPRIMFLYHYSPCVPFLTLALGYQLNHLYKNPERRTFYWGAIIAILLVFLSIYPFLTGLPMPQGGIKLFFLTNAAKDPF